MDFIEALVSTGLTGYEARLYSALLEGGPLGGYEAAKASGISRSNVYHALEGLVEKGGAYRIDGDVAKYAAVPADEYCANKQRAMASVFSLIRSEAPRKAAPCDSYLTVTGNGRIVDKMKNMVLSAKLRIYVFQSGMNCRLIGKELETALKKGVKVVIVTDRSFPLDGAEVYYTEISDSRVRLIVDSAYVLTGTLQSGDISASCLFTGNQTLITLFKEALRNEIDLIRLRRE